MRTQLQHTQENKLKNDGKINENEYDKRQIKDLDVKKYLTKGKKSSNSNERENCCESYSKCLVFWFLYFKFSIVNVQTISLFK